VISFLFHLLNHPNEPVHKNESEFLKPNTSDRRWIRSSNGKFKTKTSLL